jgi:tetratricopeptide (TPR) repeat protein
MLQALGLFEQTKGTNDPAVALCAKNLGALYRNLGRYEEAERYYRRALRIREDFQPPMHAEVATSLHDLAVLYYRQQRVDDARQYCQRALAVWEKMPEPDEHKLLLNLENLTGLECEQGNYAAARPLCRRAITLREKLWGTNHAELPKWLEQYREVLRKLNETAEADEVDARVRLMKTRIVEHH